MRRDVEIPSDGCITSVDGQVVEVNLGTLPPERMFSELSLLQEGLAEVLAFRHDGSSHTVCVTRDAVEGRAEAHWEDDLLVVAISDQELGYWPSFFLKYYRDGMAEVDHMDVEANDTRNSESVIDLVVKVAHARPPISEDQLRWRLRM